MSREELETSHTSRSFLVFHLFPIRPSQHPSALQNQLDWHIKGSPQTVEWKTRFELKQNVRTTLMCHSLMCQCISCSLLCSRWICMFAYFIIRFRRWREPEQDGCRDCNNGACRWSKCWENSKHLSVCKYFSLCEFLTSRFWIFSFGQTLTLSVPCKGF